MVAGAPEAAANVAYVSNPNDSGPGSFRAAVDKASANPSIRRIQFTGRFTIHLYQTVWFSGSQDLTIGGLWSTLDALNAGGPAFLATGGGDLTVSNLTVRRSPTEGISVDVPTSATGTISVSLLNVDILDNLGHGVFVDDQDDPSTGVLDGDSDATVDVTIVGCRFIGNGFSVSDRDGLRVNEGGNGDLRITVLFSRADENGADGIEVDEKGPGDVRVEMTGSQVTRNGVFDPADLDDGFDIDESEAGSILGFVVFSSASENYEEGFDFNENDAGDLRVDMRNVEANGNGEEGIDYEEDDDFAGGGDIVAEMSRIRANGNLGGDGGLKIREKGVGNLDVEVNFVEASQNLTSGIEIREEAAGSLAVAIERAAAVENDGHGIEIDERADGDFQATVSNSNSSDNADSGVHAQQLPAGIGALSLSAVTLNGNTDPYTNVGVTVTVTP